MKWRPIKNAPKDGSTILLLVEGIAIEGCWVPNNYDWSPSEGEWEVAALHSHGCGCCGSDNEAPSHWMPRPENP